MLELDEALLTALRARKLVYVGSPYSRYDMGIDFAFEHICAAMGELVSAGVPAYSPIVHSHPIALHSGLDPLEHKIWLPFNEAMIDASDALLVVQVPGWDKSYGVGVEIRAFAAAGKLIRYARWNPAPPLG